MWADLRLAWRQLARRPAYAVTCIAILAFGIGACTAVFSALYSTVLKPLPYPQPDRLVIVHNRFLNTPMQSAGASPADYSMLSRQPELFRETGAYYFLDLNLTGRGVPRKINAVAISSSLFQVLGAQPLAGRTFSPAEQRYNGPHAVILSESYWEAEFPRDPEILHRALRLNGELYPIVGVMPRAFEFPNAATQMWTPLALRDPADNRSFYLRMYARLAPGISFSQASSLVGELSRQNQQWHASPGWSYFLSPMLRNNDPSPRRWLWILFAAVGCFLLLVCSNIAGLVLARSSGQRSEFAIRLMLGASRARIARQSLTEILWLAAIGGFAGLAIAQAGAALLGAYPAAIETPVRWFCAGVTLLSAAVCGLFPALSSARIDDGPRSTTARAGSRWRGALIVIQVGIATALLICGGLLVRSLLRLLHTPLGFDPRGVLTMTISLPRTRYDTPESRTRFFEAVLRETSALPGVRAASACTLLPFGYGENVNTFEIVDRPKPAVNQYADMNIIAANYFAAMRIPLLRGRPFSDTDRASATPVVVIDETFARRVFPGEDPIGRQVKMGWGSTYTIAGVTGAVKISAIDLDSVPTIYFSAAQSPVTDMTLAIRSDLAGESLAGEVRRIVGAVDRDQPVYDVAPLESRIDRSLKTRRLVVSLMLLFGAAGTVLAAVGLYGLLSYTVFLRYREIGIRMALGADAANIAVLICRDGMRLTAAGMVLGSAAALAASRLIASQMYGVTLGDPATWLTVSLLVGSCGLAASALPAWRASRSSPAEALKAL